MLTEKPAIVYRWMEYVSELLNCQTTASEEALASLYQYTARKALKTR